MSDFPKVLEAIWSMQNSDINVVGVHMGYDWNQVCDEISTSCFCAEDGDGAFTVYYDKNKDYSSSVIINEIMHAIFSHHPGVKSLQIIN